ncbi:nucleotide exchange factor GrpE [Casimicrobium huifangae]|uniref:nucleotide exchange factor GrpE n=1 Tax=Casimicrobium huifangae TaxID=2591109 RepID=UPI0037843E77
MATPDEQQSTAPEQSADASVAPEAPAWASPEEKLAAAENEIAALKEQLKDQQLRNLAEMENLRKRNAQEIGNARDFAAKDFAFSLLAVKDTLEMVLKDQQSTTEERAKVKEVKAEKAKFDPNVHQAMTQIESTTDAPGTVLQVFQKGYTIADRVLRPAMVAVATAPAPKDDGAAPAAQA